MNKSEVYKKKTAHSVQTNKADALFVNTRDLLSFFSPFPIQNPSFSFFLSSPPSPPRAHTPAKNLNASRKKKKGNYFFFRGLSLLEPFLRQIRRHELTGCVVRRVRSVFGLDHHDGLLGPEQEQRRRAFAQDGRRVVERSQEHVLIDANLATFLGEHLVVLDTGNHILCLGRRHLQAIFGPGRAIVAVDPSAGHILLVLHDDFNVWFPARHYCWWLCVICVII